MGRQVVIQNPVINSPFEEPTGKIGEDKAAKVAAARNLWVPAVNNAGTWGRWAFVEIADPWDADSAIRASLRNGAGP